MVDLIQLISMQSMTTESGNVAQQEDINFQQGQEKLAFVALMAELLTNNQQSSQDITLNNQKVILPDQIETTQGIEVLTEIPELIDEGNFSEASQDIELKETPDETKEAAAVSENAIPLAWFSVSSFEPPKAQLTPSNEALPPLNLKTSTEKMPSIVLANNEEGEAAPTLKEETIILPNSAEAIKNLDKSDSVKLETSDAKNAIQKLPIVADNTLPEEAVLSKIPVETSSSQDVDMATSIINAKENIDSTGDIKIPTNQMGADSQRLIETNSPAIHSAANTNFKPHVSDTSSPKALTLAQTVSSPEWGENFNQQILWLGQQKIKSAVIKLNPQELGPLEVNIKLVKDVASVNITTHSTQVRDLIEQTIPRLRDMMTEQGVNLSQVNIESSNHQQNNSAEQSNQALTEESDEELVILTPLTTPKNKGLIDYFA
ncbi:flagellar hook-length control protein FliK [Legionella hackeliae]|uniref:Flagellar hook-length control protein-like C-terminal domain-containing protein n=1 Tax=Legionella hackeliae TaxID=449 RepID=A0A0A8UTT3_LEGHA|nr:flagellar hook-length control protein FliK [Legionella hackeliae]KTD13806.1 putative flagellar hook-length control protein [Legionella hackeliae]CEK10507.1 protein of unknown function [Legionella hackeliae]STX47244.1 flagellar hook-length control protein FliK [Legionella hackeliae]